MKERKTKVDDICSVPSLCSLGNNDIYARGNPLKDKESKLRASKASCNQQQMPDLVLIWIARHKKTRGIGIT